MNALWTSAAWREQVVAWMDRRLEEAGLRREGEPEQVRVRPWATVLRAPASGGTVWLKAAAPGTAFEAGLYETLHRLAPDRILEPIALDAARGWMLLPDAGEPLGALRDDLRVLEEVLPVYARFQRDLAPHAGELVALGVTDMRPAVLPQRFDEAAAEHPHVRPARERVVAWCAALAAAPGDPTLDHNDLHTFNVLPGARLYDWGDAVVAHPFTSLHVALGVPEWSLRTGPDDPRIVRLRDAYLEVFSDLAPHAELVQAAALARRVAPLARALVWTRALQWARPEDCTEWADAPRLELERLLEP